MQNILVDRVLEVGRDSADDHAYALGYSDREFRCLAMQGAFLGDLTEDVLRRAGIAGGMRVLDLGCGVGDVSLLAGKLVGPSGFVLGVDRSVEALETAERRATKALCCQWVRFGTAELGAWVPDGPFDAIVGRLILMYLPDPASTLRRLSACLRPGGIVAFQEMTMPLFRTIPPVPLLGRCSRWITDAIERSGFETDMGDKLFATFIAAGLPAPQMVVLGRAEGGPHSVVYDYIAETLRSLLPVLERAGIVAPVEVGIDTLADRLRDEALGHEAWVMPPPFIGAWTRTPLESETRT
jgi:ubiquinone/menaquinone biosynthesis C-methylase UbiE